MHLDMLRVSMEYRVLDQVHVADVVAIDRVWSGYFDKEFLQQTPKPYGFTGRNCSSLILNVSA